MLKWLSELHSEKGGPNRPHGVDEQRAVERDVPRLATGFGDEQAAVARGAVQHAIGLGMNRIVVGADGIARTQPRAPRDAAPETNQPFSGVAASD